MCGARIRPQWEAKKAEVHMSQELQSRDTTLRTFWKNPCHFPIDTYPANISPIEVKALQIQETSVVLCLELAGRIRREESPETVWVVAAAKGGEQVKSLGLQQGKNGELPNLAQASPEHGPETTGIEPQNSRNEIPGIFHR